MIAIGLPVRAHDFGDAVAKLGRPLEVVQGSDDEFGSPAEVRAVLDRGFPKGALTVLPGATHLFPGRVPEVAAAVRDAAERCLAGTVPPRYVPPR